MSLCAIKNCVSKTHDTGIGFNKIVADLSIINEDNEVDLKICLSTELVNDLALVRFDDVAPKAS